MRKPTSILLLALLAAAIAGNAQASSQFSAQPAGESSRMSASATVNFRIVIREDLRLGGEQQKARPNSAQLTQSLSFENGREVVTLARP